MRRQPKRPIDKTAFDVAWVHSGLDPAALDTPERILEYCKRMGFVKDGYTDIEAVIKSNPELTLTYEDLGDNDAYIKKEEDRKFILVINSKHHKNRQRFSMAHEYIHYQLHRELISSMPVGERIVYRNSERNTIEYQANRHASEILMPSETFSKFVATYAGNVAEIAKKFGVSQDAVRVRASQLGFSISDG